MTMTIRLRPAAPADAAKISRVHIKSWNETYADILPASVLAALSVKEHTKMWRGVLSDPDHMITVAETDESIVGFAGGCPSRDADALPGTGEVSAIYLLKPAWRRGVGRDLMERTLQALNEREMSQVTLWVFEANESARLFYEAMGFRRDGAKHDEPRSGKRELRYRFLVPRAGRTARIAEPHEVIYPKPIEFNRGDTVTVGRKDDEYPGWIRTTTSDGNEGWAPEQILEIEESGSAVATAAYTARELKTIEGQHVSVLRELNGWSWIRRGTEEGWVPSTTVTS